MIVINDNEVCKECGAYSAGNGWCANLPGHPFTPVTIEEYVESHPEDHVAAAYLKSREAEVAYWRQRLQEGATLEQVEQEVAAAAAAVPERSSTSGGAIQGARADTDAASLDWKRALGAPGSSRRVPRPDVDEGADPELLEYGGGPSFDDVYATPLLDWVFESRNVGRHDGHMAATVVTRNETGLPWVDGWTGGDEALDALISAAMTDLDEQIEDQLRGAAERAPVPDAAPAPPGAPAAPIAFEPFDPFTE
jgi:hypothetical protein